MRFDRLLLAAVAIFVSSTASTSRLASENAHLAQIRVAIERGDFGSSELEKQRAMQGAIHFFAPYPGGNGRSCSTCHDPADGYSLSPRTVERRWQLVQAAKRLDRHADDPLFRAIDADDGREDYSMLRSRALFKVHVPLPSRVRLADARDAHQVTVLRAVPPLSGLKHTAPYQQDRTVATLEDQVRAALVAHMEVTTPPSEEFVTSVAFFERGLYATAAARTIGAAIDAGTEIPNVEPDLSPLERRGKDRFEFFCSRCHGGPSQVVNRENRIFPPFDGSTNPVSINVGVSNPLPAGMSSVIHGPGFDLPAQRFLIDLPSGATSELLSSDPGTVLTDARALETVAGNQVFNRFDIPQLRGINATAPYFHDHRAATLEDVLRHYQQFFAFINEVRGLPLPKIPDEDIEPIIAYMRVAL